MVKHRTQPYHMLAFGEVEETGNIGVLEGEENEQGGTLSLTCGEDH